MLLLFCVGVAVLARHIMPRIYFYCFLIHFCSSVELNVSDSHGLESSILPCLPALSKCQQCFASKSAIID